MWQSTTVQTHYCRPKSKLNHSLQRRFYCFPHIFPPKSPLIVDFPQDTLLIIYFLLNHLHLFKRGTVLYWDSLQFWEMHMMSNAISQQFCLTDHIACIGQNSTFIFKALYCPHCMVSKHAQNKINKKTWAQNHHKEEGCSTLLNGPLKTVEQASELNTFQSNSWALVETWGHHGLFKLIEPSSRLTNICEYADSTWSPVKTRNGDLICCSNNMLIDFLQLVDLIKLLLHWREV